jgi:hypothetical protein
VIELQAGEFFAAPALCATAAPQHAQRAAAAATARRALRMPKA